MEGLLIHTLVRPNQVVGGSRVGNFLLIAFSDRVEIYKQGSQLVLGQTIQLVTRVLAFNAIARQRAFAIVTSPGIVKVFAKQEISDQFVGVGSVALPGVFLRPDTLRSCLISGSADMLAVSFYDGLLHLVQTSEISGTGNKTIRVQSEISALCLFGIDKIAYMAHGNLFIGNLQTQRKQEISAQLLLAAADREILVAVGNSFVTFLDDGLVGKKTQTMPAADRISGCIVPSKNSLVRVAVLLDSQLFLVSLVSRDTVILTCLGSIGNVLSHILDPPFLIYDENLLVIGDHLVTITDATVSDCQEISALRRFPITTLACTNAGVAVAGPAGVQFIRRGLEASFACVLEISQNISDLFFPDVLLVSSIAGTFTVDSTGQRDAVGNLGEPILAAGSHGLRVTRSAIHRGDRRIPMVSSLAVVSDRSILAANGRVLSEISVNDLELSNRREFPGRITAVAAGRTTAEIAVATFSIENGQVAFFWTSETPIVLATDGVMVASLGIEPGAFVLAGLGDGAPRLGGGARARLAALCQAVRGNPRQ